MGLPAQQHRRMSMTRLQPSMDLDLYETTSDAEEFSDVPQSRPIEVKSRGSPSRHAPGVTSLSLPASLSSLNLAVSDGDSTPKSLTRTHSSHRFSMQEAPSRSRLSIQNPNPTIKKRTRPVSLTLDFPPFSLASPKALKISDPMAINNQLPVIPPRSTSKMNLTELNEEQLLIKKGSPYQSADDSLLAVPSSPATSPRIPFKKKISNSLSKSIRGFSRGKHSDSLLERPESVSIQPELVIQTEQKHHDKTDPELQEMKAQNSDYDHDYLHDMSIALNSSIMLKEWIPVDVVPSGLIEPGNIKLEDVSIEASSNHLQQSEIVSPPAVPPKHSIDTTTDQVGFDTSLPRPTFRKKRPLSGASYASSVSSLLQYTSTSPPPDPSSVERRSSISLYRRFSWNARSKFSLSNEQEKEVKPSIPKLISASPLLSLPPEQLIDSISIEEREDPNPVSRWWSQKATQFRLWSVLGGTNRSVSSTGTVSCTNNMPGSNGSDSPSSMLLTDPSQHILNDLVEMDDDPSSSGSDSASISNERKSADDSEQSTALQRNSSLLRKLKRSTSSSSTSSMSSLSTPRFPAGSETKVVRRRSKSHKKKKKINRLSWNDSVAYESIWDPGARSDWSSCEDSPSLSTTSLGYIRVIGSHKTYPRSILRKPAFASTTIDHAFQDNTMIRTASQVSNWSFSFSPHILTRVHGSSSATSSLDRNSNGTHSETAMNPRKKSVWWWDEERPWYVEFQSMELSDWLERFGNNDITSISRMNMDRDFERPIQMHLPSLFVDTQV